VSREHLCPAFMGHDVLQYAATFRGDIIFHSQGRCQLIKDRHRSFVGPVASYDRVGAGQFGLLLALGMRGQHSLLDIGCGSLRGGRLAIMYLNPGNYCGVEPEKWLVQDAIRYEVGEDLIKLKCPTFLHGQDFPLAQFDRSFEYIIAQSIFSHASPSQIRRCLLEVRKVLAPNGVFIASYFRGNRDYRGSTWVYPGIVKYTFKFFADFAGELNLSCQMINWPHPHGQSWMRIKHKNRTTFATDGLGMSLLEQQLICARKRVAKFQKGSQ
jgi:SAM-dependent methyltransferase